MFKRAYALGTLATVLSALWLLAAPGFAAAQQGQRLYEWSGGWGRSSPAYTTPASSMPAYIYPAPSNAVTTSQAFYPGSEEGSAAGGAVAINVSVPAGADIWFGTAKTAQRGAFRQFVSPPIVPGYDYVYEVKAAWTENGKPITRTRNVTVHAGEVVNLKFDSSH